MFNFRQVLQCESQLAYLTSQRYRTRCQCAMRTATDGSLIHTAVNLWLFLNVPIIVKFMKRRRCGDFPRISHFCSL